MGINRNIVECKYGIQYYVSAANNVLIETLWNVNESGPTLISLSDGRINRNIVECK